MAATICAGPLIARLGASAVNAWRVALPLTLMLQWTLRRYHRSFSQTEAHERLGGLRNLRWGSTAVALAIVVPLLLVSCPLAGATVSLVVLWTGGLLLARRGWAPVYVVLLLGGALAVWLRLPIVAVVGDQSETMLGLVAVAVTSSSPSRHQPGSWLEALKSGCVGALLGCMIISVALPKGTASLKLLGLAMAPALLASVVWFYFAGAFWHLLGPGIALGSNSESLCLAHRMSKLTNLAALVGYTLTASVMSFVALGTAILLGVSSRDTGIIFLDLGTIGLAGVLFAWLDVLGRAGTVLAVECCVLGAGLLFDTFVHNGIGLYGTFFLGALAAASAEIVTYRLHREPEWLAARLL